MPIDWGPIDEEIRAAAGRTDDRLASLLSSVTRLTDEEIKVLFPTPADVAKLADLMRIVKGATGETEKLNRLTTKIEQLGGVVLTLLSRFV